jgi:hypothetical protein
VLAEGRRDGRAGSVVVTGKFGDTEVAGILVWMLESSGMRVMNGCFSLSGCDVANFREFCFCVEWDEWDKGLTCPHFVSTIPHRSAKSNSYSVILLILTAIDFITTPSLSSPRPSAVTLIVYPPDISES